MNRLALVVVMLAACSSNKEGTEAPSQTAKPSSTAPDRSAECPIPAAPGVRARFPVGAAPRYRVNSMAEAPKCYMTFIASDVVKIEGDTATLVKEGTFQGSCPGEEKYPDKFEAVKPDKAVIEVNALGGVDLGELGLGKPVVLDSANPRPVGVAARVVDRCGTPLDLGDTGDVATWTMEPACEKVAKIAPYPEPMRTPTAPTKALQMQVHAIGPGSCKLALELFGAKGETTVTVK